MQLDYLDFDHSDEENGRGSFDAMASVAADRLDALRAEIAAVLAWAHDEFGAPNAHDDTADWDYALQAAADFDRPLSVVYEEGRGEVVLDPGHGEGSSRTTLTLTLSGSPAFCDAFGRAFDAGDWHS